MRRKTVRRVAKVLGTKFKDVHAEKAAYERMSKVLVDAGKSWTACGGYTLGRTDPTPHFVFQLERGGGPAIVFDFVLSGPRVVVSLVVGEKHEDAAHPLVWDNFANEWLGFDDEDDALNVEPSDAMLEWVAATLASASSRASSSTR